MRILETTSGTTTATYTPTIKTLTTITLSNDSAASITMVTKGMTFTVLAGEVFEAVFNKPYIDTVAITATGNWRLYLGD